MLFLLFISWIPLGFTTGYIMSNSSFFGYEDCLDKMYISIFFLISSLSAFVFCIIILIFNKSINNLKKIIIIFLSVVTVFFILSCVTTENSYKSNENESYGYTEVEEKPYYLFTDKLDSKRYDDYFCIRWDENVFKTKYTRIKTQLYFAPDDDAAIYDIGYLSSDNRIINNLFIYVHNLYMNETEEVKIENKKIIAVRSIYTKKYILSDGNKTLIIQTDTDNSESDKFDDEVFYKECLRLYSVLSNETQ